MVLPLHPRTRQALDRNGFLPEAELSLCLIEPVGYLDMVMLEHNARLIATDSGGAQKEAFFYRVPCVTLRDETEWVELVELGWNKLVPPTNVQQICAAVLAKAQSGHPIADDTAQLYGNGQASLHIMRTILEVGNLK